MCEVVGDDEVFEFHAMEHAHTCTTVTVSHIINNVAMANGESVPLHIGILFIHTGLVATDIVLPVVFASVVAAILVAIVCTVIAIACHMPGCHTHVRLIQYIVSLAHACSTIGSVCGTFIYNFFSKRGYVKIVTCTTCHW